MECKLRGFRTLHVVNVSIRFRWVSLQIENLCDNERIKHEMDIRTELGRLPKTLKASYDVTFKSIENFASTSRMIAQNAMKWLMCAQRQLSSTEFIAAVSMDLDGNSISVSTSELLHICCNMVMLDTGLNIFRLVHLSVREYLESREDYLPEGNHRLATERCINSFIYAVDYPTSDRNCFSFYSALYWPTHYQYLLNVGLDMPKKKMEAFLLDSQDPASPFAQCASITTNLYESLPWTHPSKLLLREALSMPPSPVFLACCFGLPSLLELLDVSKVVDWDQRNLNGNTALHVGIASE